LLHQDTQLGKAQPQPSFCGKGLLPAWGGKSGGAQLWNRKRKGAEKEDDLCGRVSRVLSRKKVKERWKEERPMVNERDLGFRMKT